MSNLCVVNKKWVSGGVKHCGVALDFDLIGNSAKAEKSAFAVLESSLEQVIIDWAHEVAQQGLQVKNIEWEDQL